MTIKEITALLDGQNKLVTKWRSSTADQLKQACHDETIALRGYLGTKKIASDAVHLVSGSRKKRLFFGDHVAVLVLEKWIIDPTIRQFGEAVQGLNVPWYAELGLWKQKIARILLANKNNQDEATEEDDILCVYEKTYDGNFPTNSIKMWDEVPEDYTVVKT